MLEEKRQSFLLLVAKRQELTKQQWLFLKESLLLLSCCLPLHNMFKKVQLIPFLLGLAVHVFSFPKWKSGSLCIVLDPAP